MENAVLMVFAIVGVVLLSSVLPLVGLVAMALCAHAAWGPYVAIVVTLFYVRYGASIWGFYRPTFFQPGP